MSASAQNAARAIARQLIFYVQLAARPETLAEHVAGLVCAQHGHSREEVLVAVDWALAQTDLTALVRQPHDDATLRRYFAAVVEQLG